MKDFFVPMIILFIILISLQYSLNKIIILLKEIKQILSQRKA
ncbi:hypothetical protein [Alkaliphilus oremlandii]|nr:hypothetical protein [Alkaliphilus oremlandii]